jgi:hypothetical protein
MANKGCVNQRRNRVSRQSQCSRQCNCQYLQPQFIKLEAISAISQNYNLKIEKKKEKRKN